MADYDKNNREARKTNSAKELEADKSAKVSKRKDTKKWCRGKVGLEHKLQCYTFEELRVQYAYLFKGAKLLACSECGREFARWSPSYRKSKKPDWAT